MILSDISVKRPVLAGVISALLITLGILSYSRLPLRELPDIDPPIVSISTSYRGAAADIVENRVTRVIEEQIRGIAGIKSISSSSSSGQSRITAEFKLTRNLDDAANDIRDAVSRVARRLPPDVDPPLVAKADADSQAILWYNLNSTNMDIMELADYAERYVVDRLAVIDGVSRVRVGGGKRYAMRIWLDRVAMAARSITVSDVEQALRSENLELPAGTIESDTRQFPVRVARGFRTPESFASIVLRQGESGHLVRLGEVARVEIGADQPRIYFVGNGETQVGLGIVKQSTANTLAVARATRVEIDRMQSMLPDGMTLNYSFDSSVFIERAIEEVFRTLMIAVLLVIMVIYLFLGSWRAAFIPAITVPVCLISTFAVLNLFGLSINLFTLLAFILSIGLVVDDSIVVLENIKRRIDLGEPAVVAAYRGARQVGFAVVATTAVLLSVFLPIMFLQGFVGKLFIELAITLAGAVTISSLVALSLSPMMCSKLLTRKSKGTWLSRKVDRLFMKVNSAYRSSLEILVVRPLMVSALILTIVVGAGFLFRVIPSEMAPPEDRGSFFVMLQAPEGTSFSHMVSNMKQAEKIFYRLLESGDAQRVLARVPGSFGSSEDYTRGFAMIMLEDWDERERSAKDIIAGVNQDLTAIPDVQGYAVMPQGFQRHGGSSQQIQFVLSGTEYEELAGWRDIVLDRLSSDQRFIRPNSDYLETRPELQVNIDHERASDLGVTVSTIGRTLEAMIGTRRVTTFVRGGEEYDVILQGKDDDRAEPSDLTNVFVRSDRTGKLIPLSNLIDVTERADAGTRRHFNRLRSITVSTGLAPGTTMGDGLAFIEDIVEHDLPSGVVTDFKGESANYKESQSSLVFTFGMALIVVFLVLAAQFESLIHPLVIMTTVPLAVAGGLFGLFMVGSSLNVYSIIGMVILIGLSAKNGILIVEFANQLRDEGVEFKEALLKASETRLRPILMTGTSTAIGALPLVLAIGPGAGSRETIGIVIFSGVLFATFLTLFVVPVFYHLVGRSTKPPGTIAKILNSYETEASLEQPDNKAMSES